MLSFELSELIIASFFFAASLKGARSLSSFKHSSNGVVMFRLLMNAEKFSFERVDGLLNDERILCAHVNTNVTRVVHLFDWGK